MFSKLRAGLTYANVMATIAVFIALGGSSYAAIKITGRNVKNGSLTGKDVRSNSLTGRDIKETRVHRVASARTLSSKNLRVRSAQVVMIGNPQNANYNSKAVAVGCAPGEVALSAGTNWVGSIANRELLTQYVRLVPDAKGTPRGAIASGALDEPGTFVFQVQALCAG